jgi:hypothetical protein
MGQWDFTAGVSARMKAAMAYRKFICTISEELVRNDPSRLTQADVILVSQVHF